MAKKESASKAPNIAKLNETGRRQSSAERRQSAVAAPSTERRKAPRRRQIDPTTCERDYNDSEIEFMHALDDYKRASGRMFPTCSEILEVLLKLGYRKVENANNTAASGVPCGVLSEFPSASSSEITAS